MKQTVQEEQIEAATAQSSVQRCTVVLTGLLCVSAALFLLCFKVEVAVGTAKSAAKPSTPKTPCVVELNADCVKSPELAQAVPSGVLIIRSGKAEKILGQNIKGITGCVVSASGATIVLCANPKIACKRIISMEIHKTASKKTWSLSATNVIGKCIQEKSRQPRNLKRFCSNSGLMAELKSLKKSGTLQRESEVKVWSQVQASRNDYRLNLCKQNITSARGSDTGNGEKIVWTVTNKKCQNRRIKSRRDNKSIPYQRGAAAIAREITKTTKGVIQCTKEMAQQFIDGFYATYPEVRLFVDLCKMAVLNPGYLYNPFGRCRRFLGLDQSDRSFLAACQREMVNFPIQSTVADALNQARINFYYWRRLNPGLCNYKLLLAIHDACLFEVPGNQVQVLVERTIPECMVYGSEIPSWKPRADWPATKPFCLDVDIEVGMRWHVPATSIELADAGVCEAYIQKYAKDAKAA